MFPPMRTQRLLAILLAGTVAPGSMAAQDDNEADHQALRELKAVFEKAASENNLDLLRPRLHESFTAVTYTDREFTDFEAFKTRWQATRDAIVGDGSYKVVLRPERSLIQGDIAIARGDSNNLLVTGAGNEYHFTSHWTAICQKSDGQWKLLRAHSSLDPFGNPMVVADVRRKLIQVGLAAAVGGLVVGWLATRIVILRRGPVG
ncbi:MAG: nuclear transport factor 2 family protein [Pirellulales bacterium]